MGNGNVNNQLEKLTLKNDYIAHVPRRPFKWQSKNQAHPHCLIVRSFEDINTILGDPMQGLLIKVHLKHGLTGLSKVTEQEYGDQAAIKNGKFRPGTKLALA